MRPLRRTRRQSRQEGAIREQQGAANSLNGLLQGFMALGLLVGVAALGVISTRAVVERRQQHRHALGLEHLDDEPVTKGLQIHAYASSTCVDTALALPLGECRGCYSTRISVCSTHIRSFRVACTLRAMRREFSAGGVLVRRMRGRWWVALVRPRRDDAHRFGLALQLGTVRFLGTFLADPNDVPANVKRYVAHQLGLSDIPDLAGYGAERSHWRHAEDIRQRCGYRDFTDPAESFRLVRWLYSRAWLSNERPSLLFDLATARLVERKVLLPGVTVLERWVGRVRDRAARRLWRRLAAAPMPAQRTHLKSLLDRPPGAPRKRMSGSSALMCHSVAPVTCAVRLELARAWSR